MASLSREVARLRAIVDWEKALENVPYDDDEGEIHPEFVRRLTKQINRIQSGIEPIYHYDPDTFNARIAREKDTPRRKRAR